MRKSFQQGAVQTEVVKWPIHFYIYQSCQNNEYFLTLNTRYSFENVSLFLQVCLSLNFLPDCSHRRRGSLKSHSHLNPQMRSSVEKKKSQQPLSDQANLPLSLKPVLMTQMM